MNKPISKMTDEQYRVLNEQFQKKGRWTGIRNDDALRFIQDAIRHSDETGEPVGEHVAHSAVRLALSMRSLKNVRYYMKQWKWTEARVRGLLRRYGILKPVKSRIPSVSQEHPNDIPSVSQEHPECIPRPPEELAAEGVCIPSVSQEHPECIPSVSQEHPNDIPVLESQSYPNQEEERRILSNDKASSSRDDGGQSDTVSSPPALTQVASPEVTRDEDETKDILASPVTVEWRRDSWADDLDDLLEVFDLNPENEATVSVSSSVPPASPSVPRHGDDGDATTDTEQGLDDDPRTEEQQDTPLVSETSSTSSLREKGEDSPDTEVSGVLTMWEKKNVRRAENALREQQREDQYETERMEWVASYLSKVPDSLRTDAIVDRLEDVLSRRWHPDIHNGGAGDIFRLFLVIDKLNVRGLTSILELTLKEENRKCSICVPESMKEKYDKLCNAAFNAFVREQTATAEAA